MGQQVVRHNDELRSVVEEEDIVVGVLAVPTAAAQELADDLVEAGVKIIFNYSEALLHVPPEITVHTSSPAVDLLYALYSIYLSGVDDRARPAVETFAASRTSPSESRRSSRSSIPRTLDLAPRFEELRDAARRSTPSCASTSPAS